MDDRIELLHSYLVTQAPDGQPKIILRNIYQRDKIRVNKISIKKLGDGSLLMYVSNGKLANGTERYCHFKFSEENIEALKSWLKENS